MNRREELKARFAGMTVKGNWAQITKMICEVFGVRPGSVYHKQDRDRSRFYVVWYNPNDSREFHDSTLWVVIDEIPYE